MARWPAAGRCKARLAYKLGINRASSIQKQLTNHSIAVAKELEEHGLVEVRLAVTGLGWKGARRWGKRQGIKTIDTQGQGTLGARMRRQVLRVQKQSKSKHSIGKPTILIGTDLPTLCKTDLVNAIEALTSCELVLGPSKDGGYWLIGLSGTLINPVATWPFCGIPWGTDKVMEKTIHQANAVETQLQLLHEQNDLDQEEDLSPWLG